MLILLIYWLCINLYVIERHKKRRIPIETCACNDVNRIGQISIHFIEDLSRLAALVA